MVASAVITDPPYGISYQSKHRADFDRIANDERPFIWWLPGAVRVLKDPGVLICFCRWDVAEAFKDAIELAGLRVTSQLVWDRLCHGSGDTAAQLGPRHDLAWLAVKGRWKFPGVRLQSVMQHQKPHPTDLTHPTEKPVSLMSELVKGLTAPGDLVVDPFMGTGATGVACRLNGRAFIGIELDQRYALIAKRRIDEAGALFGGGE